MHIAGHEPKFKCETCRVAPRSLREGETCSTFRCPTCGALLYVFTAPFLFFWREQIPPGMTLNDFAERRRADIADNALSAMYVS